MKKRIVLLNLDRVRKPDMAFCPTRL